MNKKIIIGTSSCLMGMPVRHDGSHKKDRYTTDVLSEFFEFQSFCPETAIGLGIPRPTIRLVKQQDAIRLTDTKTGQEDFTEIMIKTSRDYAVNLEHLSGYILKSKSPSCGLMRVNLYNEKGYAEKKGVGLFAAELQKANPHLPIEEEGRLHDAGIRENFIERVFAYHRWQQMLLNDFSVASLMNFHKQHKYILLAHNEKVYRQMGKLVASSNQENLAATAQSYMDLFSEAMQSHATRKRHVNVLQHCMGYLKNAIDSDDKNELLDLFEKYSRGQVPLIVPITLLKYHFRKHPDDYINQQYYMNPYPEELMLRNHV